MGGSRALALGWPLVAGQLAATTPTLGTLSLSPATATLGVAYTGTISGATPGSNIVLDSLTVSGTGTTRTVTGTPISTGSWAAVETLSGANGSPRTTSDILLVSAASAGIQSIRADGWSGDYASTPPAFDPVSNPVTVAVSRQGFTTAGAATTITENRLITTRARQVYPNQASLDATRVAMDDYVYSTDTIAGVTNNSTVASPLPIARWARSDRRVVANSIRLEVVATHRDGRSGEPIACVVYSATDGTNTVSAPVATSTILGHAGDLNPVIGYASDLDVTTLATGAITVTAKVYPWIGGAASVLTLPTQTYLKNATLLSTPPLATISPTGNDATGVISTTQATADATPFATVHGVIAAAKVQTTVTGGVVDGLQAYVLSGSVAMGTATVAANTYQTTAEMVVTRHPSVTRAQAVMTYGAANYANRLTALRFTDMSIVRGGLFYLGGAGQTVLELVNWDNGAFNGAPWGSSAASTGWMMGVTQTNGAASVFGVGTAENKLIRGLDMRSATATQFLVEHGAVFGCYFENAIENYAPATRANVNVMADFNKFMKQRGTTSASGTVSGQDITGLSSRQNVFEYISASNAPTYRISSDNAFANTTHIVLHHNTYLGNGDLGRCNLAYDENNTDTVRRTHVLWSVVGDAESQFNTKSDVFVGVNQARPAEAPNRIGNWSVMYGVGFRGLITQYAGADQIQNGTGSNFGQAYAGADALNAAPGSPIDLKFVNPQMVTAPGGTLTAGAGGGNYAIQAGSPAIGKVKRGVLKFDMAGLARGATTASGAYAASAGN